MRKRKNNDTVFGNLALGDRTKHPKTFTGQLRKGLTGDGRKNLNTAVYEGIFGKKRRKQK